MFEEGDRVTHGEYGTGTVQTHFNGDVLMFGELRVSFDDDEYEVRTVTLHEVTPAEKDDN